MKTVHLGYEAAELRCALKCAQILLAHLQHGGLQTEEDEAAAPAAISAVMSIVLTRLNLVEKAAHGLIDPAALAADHNAFDDTEPRDDGIPVLLRPWAPKERARHLRSELTRIDSKKGAGHGRR